MNIKTWQERVKPEYHSLNIARDFMQAEIDELRAEIERLKTVPMKYRRMAFNAELQEEVAAQRKVLEQALEASQAILTDVGRANSMRGAVKVRAAITAIQEQLNGTI